MENNILIAYFSHSNNTKTVAKMLHDRVGGKLFEIQTVAPYSEDYDTCVKQAKNEQNANARPTLAENLDSVADYDTVFLAYPSWWGTMPMALWTFLESHDFSGKAILPICTNEGSGMGSSEAHLKKLCPNSIQKQGLSLRGSTVSSAQEILEKWLKANVTE